MKKNLIRSPLSVVLFLFFFSTKQGAHARVKVPDSFSLTESNKTIEIELESNSFSFKKPNLSLGQSFAYKIPLNTWDSIFNPSLKSTEIPYKIFSSEKNLWKHLSENNQIKPSLSQTHLSVPQTHTSLAEAPFKQFERFSTNHSYHNLVEELKNWLEEVRTLKEFKLTPELAQYWDSRIKDEFVSSNGILKSIPESRQYQINLNSSHGVQVATWINHLLIVQKKIDAASIHQAAQKEIVKNNNSEMNTFEINSDNFLLAQERESYLSESDKLIAFILDYSYNYKNKITPEEIDVIVSAHILLGENLENAPQSIETIVHKFLIDPKHKTPDNNFFNKEQLELWHSLQNTIRIGARKDHSEVTLKLITNIKNYLKNHTCRNISKINEGLDVAISLINQSQLAFESSDAQKKFFAQQLLNQSHKVLAVFGSAALQISSYALQFKNEN
jgi:hypothetical protein